MKAKKTGKKAAKKGKALHAGKKLEEQKPLKDFSFVRKVDQSSPTLFK